MCPCMFCMLSETTDRYIRVLVSSPQTQPFVRLSMNMAHHRVCNKASGCSQIALKLSVGSVRGKIVDPVMGIFKYFNKYDYVIKPGSRWFFNTMVGSHCVLFCSHS